MPAPRGYFKRRLPIIGQTLAQSATSAPPRPVRTDQRRPGRVLLTRTPAPAAINVAGGAPPPRVVRTDQRQSGRVLLTRTPPPASPIRGFTQASGSGSVTLNKPAGTVAGDLLAAFVVCSNTATVTPPSGWTQYQRTSYQTGADQIIAFYKAAGFSEPSSYTFSGNSGNYLGTLVSVVTSAAPEAGGNNAGAGSTATAPSITTLGANRVILVGYGLVTQTDTPASPQKSFGEQFATTPNVALDVTWFVQSSAGATGSLTATLSPASQPWGAVDLAIPPGTAPLPATLPPRVTRADQRRPGRALRTSPPVGAPSGRPSVFPPRVARVDQRQPGRALRTGPPVGAPSVRAVLPPRVIRMDLRRGGVVAGTRLPKKPPAVNVAGGAPSPRVTRVDQRQPGRVVFERPPVPPPPRACISPARAARQDQRRPGQVLLVSPPKHPPVINVAGGVIPPRAARVDQRQPGRVVFERPPVPAPPRVRIPPVRVARQDQRQPGRVVFERPPVPAPPRQLADLKPKIARVDQRRPGRVLLTRTAPPHGPQRLPIVGTCVARQDQRPPRLTLWVGRPQTSRTGHVLASQVIRRDQRQPGRATFARPVLPQQTYRNPRNVVVRQDQRQPGRVVFARPILPQQTYRNPRNVVVRQDQRQPGRVIFTRSILPQQTYRSPRNVVVRQDQRQPGRVIFTRSILPQQTYRSPRNVVVRQDQRQPGRVVALPLVRTRTAARIVSPLRVVRADQRQPGRVVFIRPLRERPRVAGPVLPPRSISPGQPRQRGRIYAIPLLRPGSAGPFPTPCQRPPLVLRPINLIPPATLHKDGPCVVDNTESVTIYAKVQDGNYSQIGVVPNALRRAATREELAAASILGKTGLVWHVWVNQLPSGAALKVHDLIIDGAGLRWRVERVELQTFQTRYKLTCQRDK